MVAVSTLLQLRTQFRTRSQTTSSYPTDAEVDTWIGDGIRALYDECIANNAAFIPWESRYVTTASGTDEYDLADDTTEPPYKIKGVTIEYGPLQHVALHQIQWADRIRFENSVGWGFAYGFSNTSRIGYWLREAIGSPGHLYIGFAPAPTGVFSVRVDCYPFPSVPTTDAGKVAAGNGWKEYILARCMWEFCMTEESQSAAFWANAMDREMARVRTAASSRDKGEPVTGVDVEYGNGPWLLPPPRTV